MAIWTPAALVFSLISTVAPVGKELLFLNSFSKCSRTGSREPWWLTWLSLKDHHGHSFSLRRRVSPIQLGAEAQLPKRRSSFWCQRKGGGVKMTTTFALRLRKALSVGLQGPRKLGVWKGGHSKEGACLSAWVLIPNLPLTSYVTFASASLPRTHTRSVNTQRGRLPRMVLGYAGEMPSTCLHVILFSIKGSSLLRSFSWLGIIETWRHHWMKQFNHFLPFFQFTGMSCVSEARPKY